MGHGFSKSKDQVSKNYVTTGKFNTEWQKRETFRSTELEENVGSHMKPDEYFGFDVKGRVILEPKITLESDGRIKVTVGIGSVGCATGPLEYCSGQQGAACKGGKEGSYPSLLSYRTFCREINVRLRTDPDTPSGKVIFIPRKSTHNPTYDEHRKFSKQTNTGASISGVGNPSLTISEKEHFSVKRSSWDVKCWNLELTKGLSNGFFWQCNLFSDLNQSTDKSISSTKRSRFRSMYRRLKMIFKSEHLQPWMHLVDRSSLWNTVNFGSSEYSDKIEYVFVSNLRKSSVVWTVEVEIPVVIVLVPKHWYQNPHVLDVRQIVVRHTFNFKDTLNPRVCPVT